MKIDDLELSRARESRAAIERLYIEMRHLFNSGAYRNLGQSGEVVTEALVTLSPEIYGSMTDPFKVELAGLIYVMDRLPRGIEECRFVKLVSEEGFSEAEFEVIVPLARRRNCYRIDKEQMFIEVTRGRSEIYDILTHLTFMYLEAEKIKNHVLNDEGEPSVEWRKLEEIVLGKKTQSEINREIALTYLSTILGRTYAETRRAYERLDENPEKNNGLFNLVYWVGRLAMEEEFEARARAVTFSPTLRERIGHHIYGERWAGAIKRFLHDHDMLDRPLHIISSNLHSVLNCLYGFPVVRKYLGKRTSLEEMALLLQQADNEHFRKRVLEFALQNGMHQIDDNFGTNISVQIFDTSRLPQDQLSPEIPFDPSYLKNEKPVIIVMDYAFGEQAFETMDELLKPFGESMDTSEERRPMPVRSISVMGKAGILKGGKGDIMIPTAHVFEGTADNYPIDNEFTAADFADTSLLVCEGPMITVLGTSLQNRDVLSYFKQSSWQAIGLEMEGAHYQKAIQAAAYIRGNISKDVTLRYAYYASDNPLLTGSTLASGSLGRIGVKPTYLITQRILSCILHPSREPKPPVKAAGTNGKPSRETTNH
jgi:hypothetical protein